MGQANRRIGELLTCGAGGRLARTIRLYAANGMIRSEDSWGFAVVFRQCGGYAGSGLHLRDNPLPNGEFIQLEFQCLIYSHYSRLTNDPRIKWTGRSAVPEEENLANDLRRNAGNCYQDRGLMCDVLVPQERRDSSSIERPLTTTNRCATQVSSHEKADWLSSRKGGEMRSPRLRPVLT